MSCPGGNCATNVDNITTYYHNPNGTWTGLSSSTPNTIPGNVKDFHAQVNFRCENNASACKLRLMLAISSASGDPEYFPNRKEFCADYNSYCSNSDVQHDLYVYNQPNLLPNITYFITTIVCDPCAITTCSGCWGNRQAFKSYMVNVA